MKTKTSLPRIWNLPNQIVGISLILAGLAFFVLLIVVLATVVPVLPFAASAAWKQYLLVVGCISGFGAFLIWMGTTYLKRKSEDRPRIRGWPNLDHRLVRFRRLLELLAVIGSTPHAGARFSSV